MSVDVRTDDSGRLFEAACDVVIIVGHKACVNM